MSTVLASQGYSIYPGSGRLLLVGTDGSQTVINVANFGASAAGAAIDTFVTAHGLARIQELLESSN